MEDANLIATLVPFDPSRRAEKAFCMKENSDFYLPPKTPESTNPNTPNLSRESTPAPQAYEDPIETFHRLELTFDRTLKSPYKGFTFGSDARQCDVLLGKRGDDPISAVHFSITFSENHHLVLKDCSRHGTSVSYNGQAKADTRHNFTWTISPARSQNDWKVVVHVDKLAFRIIPACHGTCHMEFSQNVKMFRVKARSAMPALSALDVNSQPITAEPSRPGSPGASPIYLQERRLGSGDFGDVHKIIDATSGLVYARKTFRELHEGEDKRDKWLTLARKEARIMRENPHEYIAPIIDFCERPTPFMLMPYYALGSLASQYKRQRFADGELVALLRQSLHALIHLHARGIVHRDFKPANVLIESRNPLRIRLADFGLAGDTAQLKTHCGTPKYVAPEVGFSFNYTAKVDLWSLGVVMFEYGYNLPPQQRPFDHYDWCCRIIQRANDADPESLIDLLREGMLQIEPEERCSAEACLEKGTDSGLFNMDDSSGERDDAATMTMSSYHSDADTNDYPSHRTAATQIHQMQKPAAREETQSLPAADYFARIYEIETKRRSTRWTGTRGKCTIQHALWALMADLLPSKGRRLDINEQVESELESLSRYLTDVRICTLRVADEDHRGGIQVQFHLEDGRVIRAIVKSFERKKPTGALLAHLSRQARSEAEITKEPPAKMRRIQSSTRLNDLAGKARRSGTPV